MSFFQRFKRFTPRSLSLSSLRPDMRRLVGGSLTRRIVLLNLIGLFALFYGILFLNQFQAGLIDARVQSLLIQGEILARAIAGTATVDSDVIALDTHNDSALEPDEDIGAGDKNFSINPAKTTPVVRRLLQPARLRARIYDKDGLLLLDSRYLYARNAQRSETSPGQDNFIVRAWDYLQRLLISPNLPHYVEYGTTEGKSYPEVVKALSGGSASVVRINDHDELIVSVAVPIQRQSQLVGALLLSTLGGDIDAVVNAERMGIVRVFVVASIVMILLSILMAGTIAGPLQRLAEAADRVRRGTRQREQIPDYSERLDEVGHLSSALRDMTGALYSRIEAIESFAADVAHELKNPLTSLRSAIDTLPIVKNDEDRRRLLSIIGEDVRRLDRLISDISGASRLDAELQRQNAVKLDLKELLATLVEFYKDTRNRNAPRVNLAIEDNGGAEKFILLGHETRLGQVFSNLIDNALSFSPAQATVNLRLARAGNKLAVTIDDEGPGIKAEPIERIFERFFTDRPESAFGTHSGLGLSISRQIVEAHGGTITAENRRAADGQITGARFVLTFPAAV